MDSRNLYVSFVTQLITCLVLVMGFLSIDHSTAFSQPKDEGLFTASPVVGSLSREGPTVIRKRFVTVNFKLVSGAKGSPPSEVLTLNLFPDTVFTARLERFEKTRSGYAWIGHLEGVGLSDAVLVVVDQVMVGSITMPGASYLVEFAGNGVHAIYELNEAAFPPDGPVPLLPEGTDEKQRQVPTNTALDDGSIIDVMVVYTPAARIAAGGTEAIQATIDLFVAQTNQAYQNSGINPRLRLVHTAEVSYVETGGGEDLDRLQNPSDGYMDNVHHLRNTYRADLVALITEPSTPQYCGIAYLIGTDPAHEVLAFSVTVRVCGGLVFAHELGHNQGAHHDWYVAASPGAYTYSHGHVNVARRWLTIMSYHAKCTHSGVSCNRITHFSNPDIAYDGAPTGVPPGTNLTCTEGNLNNPDCDADNRRTLNNTAYIVANFRTASVVGNDHFVNAQAISGNSGTVTGSNVGATKEPGEPNHAGNAGGASVWYRWTPSTSGSATIDTIGSNFDTLLAVYIGSAVNSLTLIASNDDIGGGNLQSRVTFTATAGTTYHIAVDGYDGATGNITLNWSFEVVNRTLTVEGAGTGSGIVTDTGISCTITAGSTSGDCSESYPDGTNVTLTAIPAPDSTFAGWTNCDAPSGNQCTMTMNAPKTVTATFNAVAGPVNDNFANAQGISEDSGSITGSNVGATKEPCEPNHYGIPGGASVWYRWTAPIGGNATFDTFGSNFDTVLAVYTGNNLCSLTHVASNDDDPIGGLQSRVSFNAVAGTTYHIAVDGFGGFSSSGAASASKDKISTAAVAMGDIVLNWSMCPGVTVTSSPKKVTYKPTPTRPSKKTITVRVTNRSGGTRVVTNIVPLLEEPFIVTRISPTLPKAIPNRRTQSFTVYTEVPAGWPPVTATQPYFITVLDCGAFTTASEPQLLVPLQVHDVQVESQGGQVRVEATGLGIASVRLQLYDLAGRLVLNKESQGDTLTLPFKTIQGRALANGVYLYVVRVRGFDGREYVSEVRKLVILR